MIRSFFDLGGLYGLTSACIIIYFKYMYSTNTKVQLSKYTSDIFLYRYIPTQKLSGNDVNRMCIFEWTHAKCENFSALSHTSSSYHGNFSIGSEIHFLQYRRKKNYLTFSLKLLHRIGLWIKFFLSEFWFR